MSKVSIQKALNNLRAISNKEFSEKVLADNPNFKNWTSRLTADIVSEKGFEQMKSIKDEDGNSMLNTFFKLSMRVALNIVNIAHFRDPLYGFDFGEAFTSDWAFYTQRIAIMPLLPTSPRYLNLQNGQSVDPYTVRIGEFSERFWEQNFNFQNFMTLQQFQAKTIFVSEYGYTEFIAGYIQQLMNSYNIQAYTMKLESINAYLQSTEHPLQETQQVQTMYPLSGTPTTEQIQDLYIQIKNVISEMEASPQTGAFNSLAYPDAQEVTRLRLLIRTGILSRLQVQVLSAAFNREEYGLGVEIRQVQNFGGLQPFADAEYTTPLYVVYDQFGAVAGYTTTQEGTTVTVDASNVYWKDPNAGIIAVLADKGAIFEIHQNSLEMEPIRNPAGLYTNYWLSEPGATYGCDFLYTMVAFYGQETEESEESDE